METVFNRFVQEINKRHDILLEPVCEQNVKEIWENGEKIDVLSFIECIITQMKIMESMNITFFAVTMEDIYVFTHEKPFYIILSEDVIDIENDRIAFLHPPLFSKDKDEYLFYPELLQMTSIPQTFHKSVIYYSFGLFVFCFLFGCPLWKDGYFLDNIPITKYIEKINETKLYYFLKRCFNYELLFL